MIIASLSFSFRFNRSWTWNKQLRQTEVTHLPRVYGWEHMLLVQWCVLPCIKNVFLKSGSGCKCILNVISQGYRIVGNIFHLTLFCRMHEKFVCSFNNVSEREKWFESVCHRQIVWDFVGLWSTNKVRRFFFQKTNWRKSKIITKLLPFFVILLNISILLFLIANTKACIQSEHWRPFSLMFFKGRFDMLSQCFLSSKKVIFYLLVLGQQPLIALQIQSFH